MSVDAMNKLKGATVQAIAMVLGASETGEPTFENLIITLKDGKVVNVEPLDVAYTQAEAINFATSWIDTKYWGE